ncbi:MAG: HD domain-containing protein [Candidatus Diapherotrites archaeon]|nr:HD domain-containing protein [Candidatus Diapherotrites archaeon]
MSLDYQKSIETFSKNQLRRIPVMTINHTIRVLKISRELAKSYPCDMELLENAIFLHNIGAADSVKNATDPFKMSAAIAKRHMMKIGYPMQKIELVLNIMDSLEMDARPERIESKILHDAYYLDLLSKEGSIELVMYLALLRKTPQDPFIVFKDLIAMFPRYLLLPESEKIGSESVKALDAFINR